jgi:hypothetical protein
VDCAASPKGPLRGGEKAGRSPVDRGKRGIKRSMAVDGEGIPIGGGLTAPAKAATTRRFWYPHPRTRLRVGRRTTRGGERASGSWLRLRAHPRAPGGARAAHRDLPEGQAGTAWDNEARWVVERTSSWHNAHKKLVWCTERRGRVVDFWVAFSEVVIIVRRLIREGWIPYRWEGRPSQRP